MDRWRNRVAVVTGASSGIGAAICVDLAKHGLRVALAVHDKNIIPYKCDLRNDSEIIQMFDWIETNPELGQVDVCIPNAGLSIGEPLMEASIEHWRNMMDVNVMSLNICTQLALKSMRKHGINDGQIIIMHSLSGHRLLPSPNVRFYSITKFAVKASMEAWRQEISPGVVETEFSPRMFANHSDPSRGAANYTAMQCLQPQDIALVARQILEAPPHVNVNDVIIRPVEQKT